MRGFHRRFSKISLTISAGTKSQVWYVIAFDALMVCPWCGPYVNDVVYSHLPKISPWTPKGARKCKDGGRWIIIEKNKSQNALVNPEMFRLFYPAVFLPSSWVSTTVDMETVWIFVLIFEPTQPFIMGLVKNTASREGLDERCDLNWGWQAGRKTTYRLSCTRAALCLGDLQ